MNCLISHLPKLAQYQFLYFLKSARRGGMLYPAERSPIYTYTLQNSGNGCKCISQTSGWLKKVSPLADYYSANVLQLKNIKFSWKLYKHYIKFFLIYHTILISLMLCVWRKVPQFIKRQTYGPPWNILLPTTLHKCKNHRAMSTQWGLVTKCTVFLRP